MSTTARSSAKQNQPPKQSDDISEGAIVQYEDDGSPILAAVIGLRKDKYLILNARGRELELARNRLHVAPGKLPANVTTAKTRIEFLEELGRRIEGESVTCGLEEVWEVVVAEPRPYDVSELSHLYFGKDDLLSHLVMRVSLLKERTFFKRDRDSFEPRPENVVADLRKAEAHRKEKLQFQEAMLKAFEDRMHNPEAVIPASASDSIRLLEEIAANTPHVEPGRQKEAKDLLAMCSDKFPVPAAANAEEKAFALLQLVGHFHRDTNLSVIRHRVPTEFSPEALSQSREISEKDSCPDPIGFTRRDLTDLFAFTVDDVSTLDMDDALSLRQTQDGFEIGVHITDVASLIPVDSPLDKEARRRASSIYCADRTINMLPEDLSEKSASLVAGSVRACISCIVHVSQRFDVTGWEITPSLIKVAKRYSYDDVDRLLDEHDRTLSVLYEIAAAHEGWRIGRGASRVQKREVVPLLEKDGTIRLLEIDEASPARMLVAEFMVLMNRFVAQFCAERKIPAWFRGQERAEQSGDDEEAAPAPNGPAKDFAARTKLRKSVTSLEPLPHASLGLNGYLQSTSPIRRYMDLCHQRQILSFLATGHPWLPASKFEELAREVEQSLEAAIIVGRETRRYWLTRYLEDRGKKKPIIATVLRVDTKVPLVELDEVFMTVFARAPKKVRVGDTVELKLTHLDSRYDYVRAEIQSIIPRDDQGSAEAE